LTPQIGRKGLGFQGFPVKRKRSQKVKKEHDIRFIEGEEHLHFDANVYED
jgi:hypothetical protein